MSLDSTSHRVSNHGTSFVKYEASVCVVFKIMLRCSRHKITKYDTVELLSYLKNDYQFYNSTSILWRGKIDY